MKKFNLLVLLTILLYSCSDNPGYYTESPKFHKKSKIMKHYHQSTTCISFESHSNIKKQRIQ